MTDAVHRPPPSGNGTGSWSARSAHAGIGGRSDKRPTLILWADSDPVLPLQTGERFAAALGTEIDHVIADASHFLQEDAGAEIGALIADWLGPPA